MSSKGFDYEGNPTVDLRIVNAGDSGDSQKWKQLSEELRQEYQYSFTPNQLRKRAAALKQKDVFAQAAPVPFSSIERERLIRENDLLRKRLEESKARRDNTLFSLEQIAQKYTLNPVEVAQLIPATELDSTFVLVLGDIHAGESIEPELVSGLGEYSWKLWDKRWWLLLTEVIARAERERVLYGYNKLVILNVGDLIDNSDIYPGQTQHIDRILLEQVVGVGSAKAQFIQKCCKHFNQVIEYTVDGNHGRIGRKGQYHEKDNFDLMINIWCRSLLKDQKNYQCIISEGPTLVQTIDGWTFGIFHGWQARSYNGFPYASILKWSEKMNHLFRVDIDYTVSGHYHEPGFFSNRHIMSGNMATASDLAVNRLGKASIATQVGFRLHPKRGIEDFWIFKLSERPKLKPDKNGSFTPTRKG